MVKTRKSSTKKKLVSAKKNVAKPSPIKSQAVYDAIKNLQERGGSSSQGVLKYLKAKSKAGPGAALQVKVALARGVKHGALVKRGNAFKLRQTAAAARKGTVKKAKPQLKVSKKAKGKTAKKTRRVSVKKLTKRAAKPRKAKANTKKAKRTGSAKEVVAGRELKRTKEFVLRRSKRLGRAAQKSAKKAIASGSRSRSSRRRV